jgi:hypothetical protein
MIKQKEACPAKKPDRLPRSKEATHDSSKDTKAQDETAVNNKKLNTRKNP